MKDKDNEERELRKKVVKILDDKEKNDEERNKEEENIRVRIKELLKNNNSKKGNLRIKLTKENLITMFGNFSNVIDEMLRDDINEYVNVGEKKSGNFKIEHGIRIKFLDDEKDEKDEKDINWIKKKKKDD
jgi:hypothetical protein